MIEIFNYFHSKFLKWRKNGKTLENIILHDFFHFSGKQLPIARIVAKKFHQKQKHWFNLA
jgi:hypothetical protein